MASHYRINDDVLDRLASGSASPPELELLRSGQLSKHLQLVTFLYGSLTAQGIS